MQAIIGTRAACRCAFWHWQLQGGKQRPGFLALGNRLITARHCIAHVFAVAERAVRLSKFLEPAIAVN
jgi:hypothetical protein